MFWAGLLLGLIIGWIIEWIIDWWFWRGNASGGGHLGYSQDFTRITGVNSDYDARLKSAGITTYSSLAGSSSGSVRSAIGGSESSSIDAEAWIAEAARLGGAGAAGGSANLATSLTGSGSAGSGSAGAGSTGAVSAGKESAGAGSGSKSAGRGVSGSGAGSASAKKPSGGSGGTSATKPSSGAGAGKTASSRPSSGSGASSARRDDLTKIHGVGKVFQGKFYDSGITTWAEVSKLSDAEIRAIIEPEEWQKIETDVWIEDARILAGGGTPPKRTTDSDSSSSSSSASSSGTSSSGSGRGRRRTDRDDLTKIHGIGRVYQGRFNDAGIFFWSDVADLSEERIRDIIDPEEWQKIEPDAWKSEARQFAAQKGGDV